MIDQHDVQIQVEQVRDRGEHLRGDLIESVEQEVHRGIRGVLGETRTALDRDPLRDPAGRGQLRARLARPLRDECEHHPGPAGLFRQTTPPNPEVRRLHTVLDLALPPRILDLDPQNPATLTRHNTCA